MKKLLPIISVGVFVLPIAVGATSIRGTSDIVFTLFNWFLLFSFAGGLLLLAIGIVQSIKKKPTRLLIVGAWVQWIVILVWAIVRFFFSLFSE